MARRERARRSRRTASARVEGEAADLQRLTWDVVTRWDTVTSG
ncbi:hypothetical protein [Streptacidiphilus neutrinimicus]|nr:hypothetical protein [Streptacidiphilus neutrinimicus]